MGQMEAAEMEHHREQLVADVRSLVEKYRAIFDWDVPEVDQAATDRLIPAAMRAAVDDAARSLGA